MKDDLNYFQMKDNLNILVNYLQMEDDINIPLNGRRHEIKKYNAS